MANGVARLESHAACELELSLQERSATVHCHDAALRHALYGDALRADLAVIHTGPAVMPFGPGWHPYFNRHGAVRLTSRVWLNDGRTPLPTVCVDATGEWDFRTGRALPERGLDNAFQARTGEAVIHWPALRLGLRINAEADAFVLHTPADHDFFCFEPVDHPLDAVHLPGGSVEHGMAMRSPLATLRHRFAFSVIGMPGSRRATDRPLEKSAHASESRCSGDPLRWNRNIRKH